VPNEFDFRVTSKNGHRPTGPWSGWCHFRTSRRV
jgi:hypothetical protein